jgi:uracil-DNA glycosylase family 4
MALDLNSRQRAMLAEMGVRLWWPETAPAAQAEPLPEVLTESRSSAQGPASQALAPRSRPTPELSKPPSTPLSVPAPSPKASETLGARPEGVARMDWVALQQAVASCDACGLCKTRKNTVFGVGAQAPEGQVPQVDWLIVGEAPGENEDLQGEPFVGQAGKLLDNMLKACGLSRHGTRGPQGGGVYIANVLKCRPPGNRNPRPDEVAQCEPYLQRQIALLQPKIIIAMGRFAVQTLLQGSVPQVEAAPLGKLRGQVYDYQGVPVVVTYHPAYLLRSLSEKAKAWADLCLAMAHLRGRG